MNDDIGVTLEAADARIAWVLNHIGMSAWLKQALRGALGENPIAVANDVEILANLLRTRADAWTHEQLRPEAAHVPEALQAA